MQKCLLLVKVYILTDTHEVQVTLTRFTFEDAEKDAEMLKYIYSNILLDPTSDCLKAVSSKLCI